MLRKIKVYGRLRKFLKWEDGTFEADVSSAAEVVRFLLANWPGVRKHMAHQHYKITVGQYNISEEELHDPAGETEAITIVPVMVGSKGAWKAVAGVALVATAIALGPVGATYFGGLITAGGGSAAIIGGLGASIMAGVGAVLIFSGASEMLTPTPEMPSGPSGESALDPNSNYAFSGLQNVSRSGTPLPLIYGYEVLVGSVVINNGIDTAQVEGTA